MGQSECDHRDRQSRQEPTDQLTRVADRHHCRDGRPAD